MIGIGFGKEIYSHTISCKILLSFLGIWGDKEG
jgi:hypothetical protein